MRIFLQSAAAAALLSIAALALELGFAVPQWQNESDEITREIYAQSYTALDTQASIRAAAAAFGKELPVTRLQAAIILQDGVEHMNARLEDTNRILREGELNLVLRLAAANDSLDMIAGSFAGAAGEVERAALSASEAAAQASNIVRDADQQFLDCKQNAACLYSRWAAGSKAFIDTMGTIDKAAPQLAEVAVANGKNIEGITADVHVVTSQFARKKRSFWGLLLDALHVAARVL